MPIGLLDLSIVTDRLIQHLTDCIEASRLWQIDPTGQFTINVTGLPPDEIRKLPDGCHLSLYLFHISQDKYQRNSAVTGPFTSGGNITRVQRIPYQPLSLDLYYLLTAFAKGSQEGTYIQEQQAMSIGLKCFHEHPIITATLPGTGDKEEFCLTMEVETADEIGRLWQAVTASLRLAVVYKVSVVFIEPESPPALTKQVQTYNLSVSPTTLPFADIGQVMTTAITVNYIGPNHTPAQPDIRHYQLFPAIVAPGQTFVLYGAGLNQPTSNHVYLLFPDGTEQDVTAWLSLNASGQTDSRLTLTLPTTGIPPVGVYQLRVGNTIALDSPGVIRSNATPFSIAAWVDPTGEPLLSAAIDGTYTINGTGFSPGTLEVLLETVPLITSAAVAPGQFTLDGSGTAIRFQLPNNLPNGRYGVRIRVNQVESPPTKWVVRES